MDANPIATGIVAYLQSNVNQVLILIGVVMGTAKWIDKRNSDRVENKVTALRKEFLGEKQDGEGGIVGDIKKDMNEGINKILEKMNNVEKNSETVLKFIEKDQARMQKEIDRLYGNQK